MFKNFIWDFDGTIVDTYPVMVLALRQALFLQNVEAPDDLLSPILQHSIRWFVKNHVPPDKQKAVYKTYQQLEHQAQVDPPLFEGAKKVLKAQIKHGGQNFLATHRNYSTKEILVKNDLTSYFNDIITSEDGFARKPDPAMLTFLIEKHHLVLSETLMIGDRPIDIVMGDNAHVKTCLFNVKEIPYAVKADYTIHTLTELLTIGR